MKRLLTAVVALAALPSAGAATFDLAARATNEFGLDLYRKIATADANLCLSPYSISCALAMTMDGADGTTRTEMAQVLHLETQAGSDASFAALQQSLGEIGPATAKLAAQSKENGGPASRSKSRWRIVCSRRRALLFGRSFSPR